MLRRWRRYYSRVGEEAAPGSGGSGFGHSVSDPDFGTGEIRRVSLRERLRPVLGVGLIAISAVIFSIMSLLVAVSGRKVPAAQMLIVRSVVQGSLIALLMWRHGVSPIPPKGTRFPVFLRGAAGSLAAVIFYYSIAPSGANLSLAEGTVVFFTAPVWSAILARVWLGEPFGRFDAGATAVAVLGVVLVAQPEFLFGAHAAEASYATGGARIRGILVCLLGAWIAAVAYVSIRSAGKGVHFFVLVFSFATFGTVAPTLYMLVAQIKPVFPPGLGTFSLFAIGLCGFVGQICLNKGMQLERAGPGATIRTLDVALLSGASG
jgi:drug/metabolite transporter (DMT)-like permease